ncbi:MAG: arginine--tRNA ligase [Desulfobacteraceae bacterium 4572_19]|nr:MAG: arginine--tRNA ligase [Desulfobacteraceae bacterium 4572_19]
MKQIIKQIILHSAKKALENGELNSSRFQEPELEEPKNELHGDFSTNFSMVSAKLQKMAPRKIAEIIINNIFDPAGIIVKTEIAGPGFINFFIDDSAWYPTLHNVHEDGAKYGSSSMGKGKKIQVEFVSANPTGPLHVGHGRGAAVGDSVANILAFSGFEVQREYYINDSGRQIRTLGKSVYLRLMQLLEKESEPETDTKIAPVEVVCKKMEKKEIDFPKECYQGDYIRDIAKKIQTDKGDEISEESEENAIAICARYAATTILDGIRSDLETFGVIFDNWFSEQTLYDSGKVASVIEDFKKRGVIYESDGAWWFKTEKFGDDKDRVVIRSNGQTTYFASDIAYHQEKFSRGFNRVIDVWGADHHGYISRMNASIEASGETAGEASEKASGKNKKSFDVILVQLVNLLRGGKPVAMSTRSGEFVTLDQVVKEVGKDAARFIFLARHYESSLDFDLELAKKKSNDNPVYYVQYVHARIASIARKGQSERGIEIPEWNTDMVSKLKEKEEVGLIKLLARYPEIVKFAAIHMEPHRITYYLMNLASAFHSYYNKHKVLTDDKQLSSARLYLIIAVQKVIKNGLALLGVSAPDKM